MGDHVSVAKSQPSSCGSSLFAFLLGVQGFRGGKIWLVRRFGGGGMHDFEQVGNFVADIKEAHRRITRRLASARFLSAAASSNRSECVSEAL